MAFDHLWMDREMLVQTVKRVENHIAVGVREPTATPDRIQPD
jgi:hypothetical protein